MCGVVVSVGILCQKRSYTEKPLTLALSCFMGKDPIRNLNELREKKVLLCYSVPVRNNIYEIQLLSYTLMIRNIGIPDGLVIIIKIELDLN